MHDCEATQGEMLDLLFGGDAAAGRGPVPSGLTACAACVAQYRSLSETLRAFDAAFEATLPSEDFWPGYRGRLEARMAQEMGTNFWRAAAEVTPPGRGEYQLTILEDAGLLTRLGAEMKSVAREYELNWPEFRRDPFGFTFRVVSGYGRLLGSVASRDYAAQALLTPLCLVVLVVSVWAASENRCRFLTLFSQRCEQALEANPYRNLELVGLIGGEVPRSQTPPEREGAAGTNKGKGGGSKPKQERQGGGGGGGRLSAQPTSFGKTAQATPQEQILTPSVRPPLRNPSLAIEPTLKGDPALLPFDPRLLPFGDPDSSSTSLSDGPGRREGQGAGVGTGQGPGDGRGYGPGRDENTGNGGPRYGGGGAGGPGDNIDYTRPFKVSEVSRRAVILYRPEPDFTEEARRNNVTGTVRLRAVLTSAGQVTNLSVLKGLPDGLTEKAVEAARRIRFTPALKNNRAVSQWVVIEYNFNIY